MKIEFEDLTFPRPETGYYTLYHYGNLIDDKGNEFSLTVVEMYDGNTDYATYEITWVDDTPKNHEELVDKILSTLEDCYKNKETINQ